MADYEDFGAIRRNAEDCEQAAEQLRMALNVGPNDRLPPVMELFERARQSLPEAKELDLVVLDEKAGLNGAAVAYPERREIHIDMNFVDRALVDDVDARFVGAHELMHVIFHRGAPKYFKKPGGNVLVPFLRDKHETAEWQADRIARALLMPRSFAQMFTNAYELAKAAGAPLIEAEKRMIELLPSRARKTPNSVARLIADLNLKTQKGVLAERKAQAASLKLDLWNALPVPPCEDSEAVRICGKYQIHWNEFGKTTGCGWFIENGAIVSFFATQNR